MNIHPWQQNILDKIESGGFKPGEIAVTYAGRGVGKSVFSSQFMEQARQANNSWYQGASAQCDDGVWHSVICFRNVATWIRAQDPSLWMETSCASSIGSTFDIAESLLVLLTLRWGHRRG